MATPPKTPSQPPVPATPRFRLELEFVLALANPDYLQYLGVTMPHLFNPSDNASASKPLKQKKDDDDDNSDAACFARYLNYLLDYWRTPEYSQYLTHPAATIRNLELLQNGHFRRDITHPALRERLAEGFAGFAPYAPPVQEPGQDAEPAETTGEANGATTEATGTNGVMAA